MNDFDRRFKQIDKDRKRAKKFPWVEFVVNLAILAFVVIIMIMRHFGII